MPLLAYPETIIWYVEASHDTYGSAVAVRLQKKGRPQSAKTYLLTCAHVLRGVAQDGKAGFGALSSEIWVWAPNSGHGERYAKEATIEIKPFEYDGEVPQEERDDAANDWVGLALPGDSSNADSVKQWLSSDLDGKSYMIVGYPGGERSFPDGNVIPTQTNNFPYKGEGNGILRLTGEETRPGMSGGGVFVSDSKIFAGIHRGRDDPTLQVHAISAKKIRERLGELGYEVIVYPENAISTASNLGAVYEPMTDASNPFTKLIKLCTYPITPTICNELIQGLTVIEKKFPDFHQCISNLISRINEFRPICLETKIQRENYLKQVKSELENLKEATH